MIVGAFTKDDIVDFLKAIHTQVTKHLGKSHNGFLANGLLEVHRAKIDPETAIEEINGTR